MDTHDLLGMRLKLFVCSFLILLTTSCSQHNNHTLPVVGELEWERIELINELSEPIIARHAAEGDELQAGALILSLDPRRTAANLQALIANRNLLASKLQELVAGSRIEDVEQAKQSVIQSQSGLTLARLEYQRIKTLQKQHHLSQEELDKAFNALQNQGAALTAANANLHKLQAGNRIEQIEQAKQALQVAEQQVKHDEITLQHLQIRAPRAGRLDSLPFEIGEQPPVGSTVAVMLGGKQPYARIHIPEQIRAWIKPGTPATVQIDGVNQHFTAKVRSIHTAPDFTPYYALTETDRSRLSYLAKLDFVEAQVTNLPAGLPLTVTFNLDKLKSIHSEATSK
ncbi:HlyD family secretion protein [Thiomicrorhabdus arctica]|uniref:HlyD family secretion protein n=1 Tax=Thiomicrorhabdus arctica TaxID=131540 RepID=UPI000380DB6C|nr:HlyD family efflux transporter periplasmic adaptor subunit [Thiomicrorhabdus arctica]